MQILNCPNYVQLNPQKYWHSLFHLSPQQKVFIYQGLFSKGRGLEDLINAFSQLSENYVLVLMGKGPLEAFLRGKAEKLPNVFIHNFTAAQDMLNYTASADFGIVPTELIGLNNTLSLPNKYFEYLMAGLPLICIDSPEMGYFIKKFQCGTTFSKNSPEDILNSIERIVTEDYSQLKNRALDVAKNYCWETQEPKLLEIYENL